VEAVLEQFLESSLVGIEVECNVSQEMMWLRNGDSSGKPEEGKRTPLEAGTRGLVKTQCLLC
jgi:hypothetical protein